MSRTFADAIADLPEGVRRRLADPISVVGAEPSEPVAFAGFVRRGGERGLLVLTDRRLVFAPETGGVDVTALEELSLAVPRETLLTVAPGTGGRLQDEFRPQKPASFDAVEWPAALLARSPASPGYERADRDGRGRVAVWALVVLVVVAAVVAALLLA